ncbi:sensor histidine kinase [Paenibacillus sp. NPDC058071]|uniref:sensor histidine kinase n=1 Tax=Paenibacillus sp. NPDC058071 TaxID=3346326 RepID=UPI0036DBCB87
MKRMRVYQLLKSGLAAALTFVTVMASTSILFGMINRQYEQQQAVQATYLLSSLYAMHEGWENTGEALSELPAVKQWKLYVWSAEHRLVWPDPQDKHALSMADSIPALERRPIVLQGEVIGSFSGGFSLGKLLASAPLGIAGVSSAAVGAIVFIMLSRRDKGAQRQVTQLRQQLETLALKPPYAVMEASELSELTYCSQLLTQVEERVKRLETVRKSMVADIAHELRTPLSVLRVKLESALQHEQQLAVQDVLLLQDEVYRMSQLLGDLQQLALAESGHLRLSPRWFSLDELAGKLVMLLEGEAQEQGISMQVNSKAAVHIYADEDRIKQVMLNVLGNALRYARSTVTVKLAAEQHQCSLHIADDGPGMEEDELPHVFERFYQGSAKRRDHGTRQGLGLGLAIVKSLVEAHNGSITVSSNWGEGTSFFIVLPIMYEPS